MTDTKRSNRPRRTFWRTWGQDPTRLGRTFASYADARVWAETEAPLSCGWAFIENTRTNELETIRAA